MNRLQLVGLSIWLCGCTSLDVLGHDEPVLDGGLLDADAADVEAGGPDSGALPIPTTQVNALLNDAFLQLFFGEPETEAIFFDQGDGTAYIEDIAHGDVRTDSMGYGMLVTVQLDQRQVFDKLWSWAKTNMIGGEGPTEGLLRWRCDTSGNGCSNSAATDASSIIVTSLLMAQQHWGDGGVHPYQQDAVDLLEAMTTVEDRFPEQAPQVSNCFDLDEALPRLGSTSPEPETPSDYLMPAFYEIWARYDLERAELWHRMAERSRELLQLVPDPVTGLIPEVVTYEGEPVPGKDDYRLTTSRTMLNLALDYYWNGPFDWVSAQNELRLDFFLDQGITQYVTDYTLDGVPLAPFNTLAHRSVVALAAGTSQNEKYQVFLDDLLSESTPSGEYRYFDGMLYVLSLLVLSGQMSPA